MIFLYFIALSFMLFSIGLVGVAATRHFLLMLLSIEIIISAAILFSVASFSYVASGDIIALLFSLWAVAASETIGMIAIYRYMYKNEISMDMGKLLKLRDW
jgi:NADH:ubiquinone oxidoreductase subunit K